MTLRETIRTHTPVTGLADKLNIRNAADKAYHSGLITIQEYWIIVSKHC